MTLIRDDGLGDGERLILAGLTALGDGLSRFSRSVVRSAAIWRRNESVRVFDPYGLLRAVPVDPVVLEPATDPLGTHFDAGARLVGCKRHFDEELVGGIGTLCLIADAPQTIMRHAHLTTWLRLALEALAVDIVAGEEPGRPFPAGVLQSENLDRLGRQIVAGALSSGPGHEITRIYAVRRALDLAEELSLQREEGARIEGGIAFPAKLNFEVPVLIDGLAEFTDVKLLGKLVMAGGRDHDLVVGALTRVLGYRARDQREETDVIVEMRATGEAVLRRHEVLHAAFKGGRLYGVCLESELSAIENVVRSYVQGHGGNPGLPRFLRKLLSRVSGGCSVTIGPEAAERGLRIQPPRPCNELSTLELAASMSGVDGALAIGLDGSLLAFGCLLDGVATETEVRARGSRFNSVVRFTAANPGTLGLVLSSDGLVSVVEGGKETFPSSPFRGQSVVDEYSELDLEVYDDQILQVQPFTDDAPGG